MSHAVLRGEFCGAFLAELYDSSEGSQQTMAIQNKCVTTCESFKLKLII